jgi:hypothetical protein
VKFFLEDREMGDLWVKGEGDLTDSPRTIKTRSEREAKFS